MQQLRLTRTSMDRSLLLLCDKEPVGPLRPPWDNRTLAKGQEPVRSDPGAPTPIKRSRDSGLIWGLYQDAVEIHFVMPSYLDQSKQNSFLLAVLPGVLSGVEAGDEFFFLSEPRDGHGEAVLDETFPCPDARVGTGDPVACSTTSCTVSTCSEHQAADSYCSIWRLVQGDEAA